MSRKREPVPTDDEPGEDPGEMFRAAVGPVRPLPATPAPPARPKPRARARMAERDEHDARGEFQRGMDNEAYQLERGDAMAYRRDHVPAQLLRRLARGDYSAQDELDLHHADARRAEQLLRIFLADARAAGHGCVCIVHGKGLHSEGSFPVLKNLVDHTLRQRADVLAFHSAPAALGGTGAVLVLLAPRQG
jgi:DNA-nicking Smr family endonuclease